MPLIKANGRVMQDGTKMIQYTDTVGPSYVTYTLENEQELLVIANKGIKPITFTVGTTTATLEPGQRQRVQEFFTSFMVKSSEGIQQFEVWMDEAGTVGASPEAIQTLDSKVSSLTSELAQKVNLDDSAITPEKFTGNTLQKLQSAIDEAISSKKFVKLNKMYDITGGSLIINKLPDAGDRRVLYIVGDGGGIIKNDAGYIFDALENNVGDISVSKCRFVSVEGVGTTVWNADRILRIHSFDNEYYNVDHVFYQINTDGGIKGAGRFTQSLRFSKEHIVGGKGWAFLAYKYIDTSIIDCLIEWREHGVGQLENTLADNEGFIQNHNLRIENNLIEGLTGTAIQLGSSWGTTISKNYFEFNEGYIDLATLNKYHHFGLVVMNNAIYLKQEQKDAGFKPIKVSNLFNLDAGNLKMDANAFIGNTSDGELYEKTGTGTLNSIGDYAFQQAGFTKDVRPITGVNTITTSANHQVRVSGITKGYSFIHNASLLANETKTIDIPVTDSEMGNPINSKDAINVYVGQVSSVSVLGVSPIWQTASTGVLKVALQNRTANDLATVTLTISVTKIYS